jgi:hypothetical protein
MRQLSKQWTDKKPFSRRVRWYAKGLDSYESRNTDVKLQFVDEFGCVNRYYGNNGAMAECDFNHFKAGTITTVELRRKE